MSNYMSVYELSKEQFEELKDSYFYTVDNSYDYPSEIPDSVVQEHYKDICFVNDDFFEDWDFYETEYKYYYFYLCENI